MQRYGCCQQSRTVLCDEKPKVGFDTVLNIII